jgi:RNA polymerase sigma-70 factor (ECF subfamily)
VRHHLTQAVLSAHGFPSKPVRYNPAVVSSSLRNPEAQHEATEIDLALLKRMVARDATAVGELYDRHSRLLYGLILRVLGQRGDAEEVLQEVFLAVWNRSDQYDAALGTPIAWLVRIARNRAVDRLRANTVRVKAVETAAADLPAMESPEARAVTSEQQRVVSRALSALPADQRVLIEEAYFLGLTQSELAARHHLPLGTVKTRIRTGMLALRQHLAPLDITE